MPRPASPDLHALLAPRSVAVVGASRTPGKVGHALVATMIGDGFPGEVVPVNPNAASILGRTCHASLADVPGDVDLVVISRPRDAVEAAVEEALAKGARAILVVAAGFGETGGDGARLEARLAARCREQGVPMVGPNSVGILNTHARLNASFAAHLPKAGGVSLISQSGAVCAAVLDLAAGRGLGMAKMVSTGNQAGLTETELLAALGDDPETSVVIGYFERIRSGEAFVRTAARVSARKPVIVLKAGTTSWGAAAVASHIGGRAGGDEVYRAAFQRAGVVRAARFEELIDYALAFATQPLPGGRRVAIVTDGGGPGTIAADAMAALGLEPASLQSRTRDRLLGLLPDMASLGNPIDVLDDAGCDRLADVLSGVLEDAGVDAAVALLRPVAGADGACTADAVVGAARTGKPVVAGVLGGDAMRPVRERLRAGGLPDYPSPERAVAALHALSRYAEWRSRPPRALTRFPVSRRRVERVIARVREAGGTELGWVKAKQVLQAYDFRVAPGRMASSAAEAVDIATHLGLPVALKLLAFHPDQPAGASERRLNVATPELVRDGYDLLLARRGKRGDGAPIEGVYVERMPRPGTDVVIGLSRDPHFGPVLMFGLAGVYLETLRDVAVDLAPITADEAVEMIRATRSFTHRSDGGGIDGADPRAIAECLQRLSQLATDFPEIAEVAIDPLVVGPPGSESVAADGRIRLAEAAGST